jgi:rod shape-determining protein MreC
MKVTSLLQYRRTVVLAALLFLSALLYVLNSVQPAAVQGLRSAVLDVYSPVLWAGDWLRRQVAKPFETLFAYDALKRENEALKIEVAELRARYDGLSDAHQTLRRLARWEFGEQRGVERCVPARVIGLHLGGMAQTAILDKGREEGIVDNAPVVAPGGLVGVVRQTGAHSATMQIVSDPNCSVGVVIEETQERGLLRGTGTPTALEFLLESPSRAIKEGQSVRTAGITGSRYPAGLLVGRVEGIRRDKFGNTVAEVEPAADLARLDAVLVLLESPDTEEQAAETPVSEPHADKAL